MQCDLRHTSLQDFLLKNEAAFRAHPVWASAPGEHQQQAIEVRARLAAWPAPAAS